MFWIIFVIVPIIILALFSWKKPAMAPWAIIICPVINLIFFFREFMYYEARGLLLFFTAIQVMIVAVAAFVVRWQGNKQ